MKLSARGRKVVSKEKVGSYTAVLVTDTNRAGTVVKVLCKHQSGVYHEVRTALTIEEGQRKMVSYLTRMIALEV
jgi:hypothetical protein